MIEFGRFRARRVSAGRYIVERQKRTRWYYSGVISRVRPHMGKAATCWGFSGRDVVFQRYGYRTLRDAIHGYESKAT